MDLISAERIYVERAHLRQKNLPHSENRTWHLVIGMNKYNYIVGRIPNIDALSHDLNPEPKPHLPQR